MVGIIALIYCDRWYEQTKMKHDKTCICHAMPMIVFTVSYCRRWSWCLLWDSYFCTSKDREHLSSWYCRFKIYRQLRVLLWCSIFLIYPRLSGFLYCYWAISWLSPVKQPIRISMNKTMSITKVTQHKTTNVRFFSPRGPVPFIYGTWNSHYHYCASRCLPNITMLVLQQPEYWLVL